MPSQTLRSIRSVAVVGTLFAFSFGVSACSEPSDPTAQAALAPNGSQTGTQGDSVTKPSGGGAVAGIRISPQRLSMPVGGIAQLSVLPVDANGVPSLALLAGRPTWAVSNPAIATITADGNVRGISAGTTKVYAVVGTYKDSSIVDVIVTRDTTIVVDTTRTGGNPPRPPSTPVSSFTLTTFVFGRATPATPRDTANVVQIAGAALSVYKLSANPALPSDSLSVRTLVQTATADNNGMAVITGLSSGYYSVVATGTYAGVAMEGRIDFGPPYVTDFQAAIYLNRK